MLRPLLTGAAGVVAPLAPSAPPSLAGGLVSAGGAEGVWGALQGGLLLGGQQLVPEPLLLLLLSDLLHLRTPHLIFNNVST